MYRVQNVKRAANNPLGVSHGAFSDEIEALTGVRTLLRFLPQNNKDTPPILHSNDNPNRQDDSLDSIIPWDTNKSYDMRDIIRIIIDNRVFFELQQEFAPNILTGFGRLSGSTVGIIANQPCVSSGVLDIDASCKAARFVRFCDSFGIPIITFVDVPGFLPGRAQEHGGIIRHGAKLLHSYAAASVPLITVITRKAYGGAYDVMSSRHIGADRVYGWPSAEIAVMGEAGARKILKDYNVDSSVVNTAKLGHIDAVIKPSSTRSRLIRDLESFLPHYSRVKLLKKHGNIPL